MCVFGNHTDTGGPHLLPLTTPFTTCLGVTPRPSERNAPGRVPGARVTHCQKLKPLIRIASGLHFRIRGRTHASDGPVGPAHELSVSLSHMLVPLLDVS